MGDKPTPTRGSAAEIDAATRVSIFGCCLVGLFVLAFLGAGVLLLVGHIFELPGVMHSGEELRDALVGVLRVVAMVGTPVLALLATGWTVFLVVMFVKNPDAVLAGAVMVGVLVAGTVVIVVVAEAVGRFVGWVLAPVMLGAAGVAGKIASQGASNAGQMALQAGVAEFGADDAIGAVLVTPFLWLMVLLLTNWLGWTSIAWLPGS